MAETRMLLSFFRFASSAFASECKSNVRVFKLPVFLSRISISYFSLAILLFAFLLWPLVAFGDQHFFLLRTTLSMVLILLPFFRHSKLQCYPKRFGGVDGAPFGLFLTSRKY